MAEERDHELRRQLGAAPCIAAAGLGRADCEGCSRVKSWA
eukprot:CAMPEP_0185166540 /NCGR_PEP_ID=MMETSP1139-20130426/12789_1 /TAXON_ID=298111 /ORGANISM="Pavlova sp., Strain CCMP459" /LENGTH=39 /DNA_ID= /DNA_START= /DNA_END= /DNA_ORIENTATION=